MIGLGMSCQKLAAIGDYSSIAAGVVQTGNISKMCPEFPGETRARSAAPLENILQLLAIIVENLFLRVGRRAALSPVVFVDLLSRRLRVRRRRLAFPKNSREIVPVEPNEQCQKPNDEREEEKQNNRTEPAPFALFLSRHVN